MAQRDEELVEREEDAAASEAGRIGGRTPDDADQERRPVQEAGGGEAEGFEDAEQTLIDHAELAPERRGAKKATRVSRPGPDPESRGA